MIKKVIALFLVLILMCGAMPGVFASEPSDPFEPPDDVCLSDPAETPEPTISDDLIEPDNPEEFPDLPNPPDPDELDEPGESDDFPILPQSAPPPPSDDARYGGDFTYDRVIVKLADNPRMRSFPNLGVDITDFRLLNPSIEVADANTFSVMNSDSAHNNIYALTLAETGKDAVIEALDALNSNPAVEFAEPNYILKPLRVPNDPLYDANQSTVMQMIGAPRAWDTVRGSKSVVVGILDTGIQGNHPDLAPNLWVNPNPGQGTYTNDINGYGFGLGKGGTPEDPVFSGDGNGHGTHVAGIVGAKGNNNIGISGMNWDVSLAWLGLADSSGVMTQEAAIDAINYAKNHNIPIINASIGVEFPAQGLESAIASYTGLLIAAAGNQNSNNDTTPVYPASYKMAHIISVANVTLSDSKAGSSNYGTSVHIAAPGQSISSTYNNGAYATMSGTSMAAPFVAGTAALVLAKNPDYTRTQLKNALLSTSRKVTGLNQWGGFGILDAGTAVAGTPPAPAGTWILTNGKWYYQRQNGSMVKNSWDFINGLWYYFNADGSMKSGWHHESGLAISGRSFYLGRGSTAYGDGSGGMRSNQWMLIDGKWYFHQANGGVIKNDWGFINGMWYYFNTDGSMRSGWFHESGAATIGRSFYLGNGNTAAGNNTGGMRSNQWIQIDGKSYFHRSSGGIIKNDWFEYNGNWYWFKSDGSMAANETLNINGTSRSFRSDGTLIR